MIRGETYHFEVVANESARGLMDLTLDGLAIGNGILTVENEAQAIARADPAQGDKGGGAARGRACAARPREALRSLAPTTPRCGAAAPGSSANCRRHIRARPRSPRRAAPASRAADPPARASIAVVGAARKSSPPPTRRGGKLDQLDLFGRRRADRPTCALRASRTASASRLPDRRRTTADRSPSGRRSSCITGTVIGIFSPSRDLAKI